MVRQEWCKVENVNFSRFSSLLFKTKSTNNKSRTIGFLNRNGTHSQQRTGSYYCFEEYCSTLKMSGL